MKKTILFFVAHLCFLYGFSQQWTSLNSGTTADLSTVWFVDANTGWVAGKDSTLLKTTDGGASWIPQPFPGADHNPSNAGNIASVSFLNSNQGFLAYEFNNAPVQTFDGGQFWGQMPIVNASICYAKGVEYLDAFGGAVWGRGCFGGAYVSFYGGFGWLNPQLIYYGQQQSGVAGFSRDSVNLKVYAAVEEGVLVRANGQFINFDTVRVTDTTLWDVEWVQGGLVYLLRTDLYAPVLISTDSGATFTEDTSYMATFAYPTLKDVDFRGPSSGFMAGSSFSDIQGILYNKDIYGFWEFQMTDKPMTKVYAVSPGLAFAVGDSGQIYKFENPQLSVIPESIDNKGVHIYPNPSEDGNVNFALGSFTGTESLCIFDLSGKKVYETSVQGGQIITINPENLGLKRGVYVVKSSTHPKGVKWIIQ